jgi:hypothetical protein
MAEFRESGIFNLSPSIGDGSNRVFATPSIYRTGTIRVFVNGIMYPPDDDQFGWIVSSLTTIEMFIAPRSGDVMAAFYQEETSVFGSDDVAGHPYPPSEL